MSDPPHPKNSLSAASLLVSTGRDLPPGSPLNRPIVPASNFILGTERAYSRAGGTPTWEALEELVGLLDGGDTVAFSSGMAGIAAVFDQRHVGSKVILLNDCYQGVVDLAEAGERKGFWSLERLAVDDTAGWVAACVDADLIWLESPSNPLLTVADLRSICAASGKA